MVARALRGLWLPLACVLFVIVNGLLMTKDFYWLNILPVVLLLAWAMVSAADRVLLFVVFATPLSINLEQLELGGIGVSLPTEPLMVCLMLLFFLKLGLERDTIDRRVWQHPVTLVVGLQLLWMAFCIIPSSMPLVSAKYLLARLWFVCTMYFMCTRLFEREVDRHRFFWMYLGGLSLVITYTLIRHASFGFAHDPAHWVMEPFFKDHTSYGAIIAFFIPFAVTAITMPSYSIGKRILGSLMLLVLTLGMVFSYTRAAWVGVVGALALFVVMRLRIPAWVVGAVAVVGGGLYLANEEQITIFLEHNRDESSDDLAKHVSSIGNISSDASNLERINRWHCALRMFEERPFTGWGPGTYMFQYAPFQTAEDRTIISTNFGTIGNAHSEFLGPLAEQGALGMLFVIGIVAVTSWTAIRAWVRMPVGTDRHMLGAAFFGLITYYTHGTINNFLDLDKASVPFWGFTALVVVLDLRYPAVPKGNVPDPTPSA
jgi:putative inorganic carbon (hco3(-)) transporter